MRTLAFAVLFVRGLLLAQDPHTTKGFDHFYNLEYDEAIREFSQSIQAAPTDPDRHNHLAQAILYREMHRAGQLESELVSGANPFLRREKLKPSPEDEKRFDAAIETAIKLAESKRASNKTSPAALYSMGVSYGLRANYNFLVRKEWFDALRDATESRKLHAEAVEIKPSLIDARLIEGVHDYVVGSLPWYVKLMGFVAGFRGDKEEGIRTLEFVAQKGDRNRVDAQILLAVVYRREKMPGKAVPMVEGLVKRFPRNYLFRFELVQMFSDLGDKDKALRVLQDIEDLKRKAASGFTEFPVEKIYYARGVLHFWYNDLDLAVENLRKVTPRSDDLDPHTGVLAWMRLGQTYDLKGRRKEAVEAYRQAAARAPESDAARESERYISSPYRREKEKG